MCMQGKSLSLLCAAFSWLRDWLEEQRAQTGASQEEVSVSDAGSDWVQAHLRKREREEKEQLQVCWRVLLSRRPLCDAVFLMRECMCQLDALEREARRAKRLKAASAAGSDVVLVPVAPGGGGRSRGNNKRRKKNGVDPEDKYALEDELEGAPGQGKGAKDVEEEGSNEHALLVKQGVEDDEAEEEVFKVCFFPSLSSLPHSFLSLSLSLSFFLCAHIFLSGPMCHVTRFPLLSFFRSSFLLLVSLSCLQIYFCSRTHSQLAQVVREFRKTCFSDQFRRWGLAALSSPSSSFPVAPNQKNTRTHIHCFCSPA